MGGFRSLAYPVFVFLVKALPFLLVAALALVVLSVFRSAPGQRRAGLYGLLSLAGLSAPDGLLLSALPLLKLSYGPVLFSLVILFALRASLFMVWVAARARSMRKNRPPAAMRQHL